MDVEKLRKQGKFQRTVTEELYSLIKGESLTTTDARKPVVNVSWIDASW
jgi:hypothetical protein